MYSPTQNLNFEKKQITTMTSKQNITGVKQIREKINMNDIEGLNLLDVETTPIIINENKIMIVTKNEDNSFEDIISIK